MSEVICEPLPIVHPGLVLREVVVPSLQKAGVTKVRLAELLGMSRQNLENVLNGLQPVRPEVAVRLDRLFGCAGEWWLKMQARWDYAQAVASIAAELEQLPDLSATEKLLAA